MSKILVLDLEQLEGTLKRFGYSYEKQTKGSDGKDVVTDTADLAIRSMLSLLKRCEVNVIEFGAKIKGNGLFLSEGVAQVIMGFAKELENLESGTELQILVVRKEEC